MKNSLISFFSFVRKNSLLPLFVVFCTIILALSIRGLPGNPTSHQLNTRAWTDEGPLELSPERARYALMYSVVEDKSLFFSSDLAQFATPDLGYKDGNYVSLFAPAVSFLVIPGYVIGKLYGISQVGAFAVIALFALLNTILIRAIAMRMGANSFASILGGLIFLFATPAFTYASTLYQHHISTALILLSLYILLRWNSMWALFFIWFFTACSIAVDYPNAFLMLPICIYALGRIFVFHKENNVVKMNIRFAGFFTFLGAVIPLVLFLWFNNLSYGNPFQLSGTVPSVKSFQQTSDRKIESENTHKKKKVATAFFDSRNILNGLYIHFLSPDRGVIYYSPVMFVGGLGLVYAYKKRKQTTAVVLAVIGMDVLLYSMWGDPWGGWAFGSRYLIPTYALLAITIPFVIPAIKKNKLLVAFLAFLVIYSTAVNTLGSITTSKIPPKAEAESLALISGRNEEYTYGRDYTFLRKAGSKSYVFQAFVKNYINSENYYLSLLIIIIGFDIIMLSLSLRKQNYE